MRTGADSSNYTGVPNSSWDGLAEQIDLLSPQAIAPPAGYPRGATREQVQWSLDHGKLTVPYVWKWWGTGLDDIKRRLDLLEPFAGVCDHLSLDVEDTLVGVLRVQRRALVQPPPGALARIRRQPPPGTRPQLKPGATSLQARIDELAAALEVCDQFPTKYGLPTMIYTGGWYWGPYMGGTTEFSARALWASLYDYIPDPRVWTPFGGWQQLAMKQYQGTSTLAGVGNLDLNVLADGYLLEELLLEGPGINVGSFPDEISQPEPTRLLSLGFKWARLVSAERNAEYIARCLAAGLDILPIITGESRGWVPPGVRVAQFGNETDANVVPRWPQPEEFVPLFNQYQGTYPYLQWIGAGMASGDPAWWANVVPNLNACAAVAVHPYNKDVEEAEALLDQYLAITPTLVVSEYNRPAREIPGFVNMLNRRAKAHAWAHWTDKQTLGTEGIRLGLVDEYGNEKPELAEMARALGAAPPEPTPDDWRSMVISTAGELGAVADQMDATIAECEAHVEALKSLAQGVRDRADRILA